MDFNNSDRRLLGKEGDVKEIQNISGWIFAPILSDFLNVTGNIIIFTLVYKDSKIGTVASKLFVNQAVADGLVGLVFLSFAFIPFDKSPLFTTSVRVCLVALYSESLQTLGAIAFFLHLAICKPLRYKIYTQTWTVAVFIIITWITNFAIGCLFFVADDTFTNKDLVLFSFYRHKSQDIWYEVLKMATMFLGPLLGVVCFIKVILFKRAVSSDDVSSQRRTKQLVSQSQGVLFMSTVYTVAFLTQIIAENMSPMIEGDQTTNSLLVIHLIVYQYLVFKLPLFLLFFKSYRKVARRMYCRCLSRNQVSPGDTEDKTHHNNRSRTATTKTTSLNGPNNGMLHPKWTPSSASTSCELEQGDTTHPKTEPEGNKQLKTDDNGLTLQDVQDAE